MTHFNKTPLSFITEIISQMETGSNVFTEDQKQCICESYDNGLLPEEVASMLDHSNMVIDNETKSY